jgi:hypothetical protein
MQMHVQMTLANGLCIGHYVTIPDLLPDTLALLITLGL